jgi:hypothetical protein
VWSGASAPAVLVRKMCILILVLLKEKSDGYDHRWPVVLAGRKRGDRVQKFVLREQAIKVLGLEDVAKMKTA